MEGTYHSKDEILSKSEHKCKAQRREPQKY